MRHASLNGIQTGAPLRFTPRMAGYAALLAALASLLAFLVFTRSDVETLLLRAPGGLYQEMPGGRIANLYTVKVVNKSSHDLPVSFRLLNVEGRVQLAGGEGFVVGRERLGERSLVVDIEASRLAGRRTPLVIGIFSGERGLLMNQELTKQLPATSLGKRLPPLETSLAFFWDYGRVYTHEVRTTEPKNFTLQSVGFGLRANIGTHFSATLDYGRQAKDPKYTDLARGRLHARVMLSY